MKLTLNFVILALCVVAAQANIVDEVKKEVVNMIEKAVAHVDDAPKSKALKKIINHVCEKFTGKLQKMIDEINKAATTLGATAGQNEFEALEKKTTDSNNQLKAMHPSNNPSTIGTLIGDTVKKIKNGGETAYTELETVTGEFPGHLKKVNDGLDAVYKKFQPGDKKAAENVRDTVKDLYDVAMGEHKKACERRRKTMDDLIAKQK